MVCCTATRATAGAFLLVLTGCQLEDVYIYRDGGTAAVERPAIGGADDVFLFLQSSTWAMQASEIPTHPNGYDEDVNFGQASQCLHRVTMVVSDRAFRISTMNGTLNGAPRSGDSGTCDRFTPNGNELHFDTTAALIENVAGDGSCFDITLTYAGFGQEGRGAIIDERTVALELYFRDQAIGHRCKEGEVGARSVTLNQEPFSGSSVQRYRREEGDRT